LLKKAILLFLASTVCLASSLAFSQSAAPWSAKVASFEEKLGPDDGAALAILFGANMRGNLELCDCTFPRGGLARRVGYIEGFKRKFKETPVIHVEAGFFLYDATGYRPEIVLQNEQVTRAYSRWPVDVINLGRRDLIFAQRLLAREGYEQRAASLPMMNNLISANGVFASGVAVPPPYIIKEVTGPRIKGRQNKIRVGFIGLAEPIRPAEGRDGMVKDIFETARSVVPLARKECDLLVIVAHCELKSAVRLAEENPQADIVIAGDADGLYKPRQVGNTLVVFAAPGNIQQGDLRVYQSKDGRMSFKFMSMDLDATVPADPKAAAFTEAMRLERERSRQD
jgi:2',3'-cyclic-nucleotide 2'-phosphodiesterase (5'-nucleotidase family)